MENKEIIFTNSLEAVKEFAKKQGNLITADAVKEFFAEQELSENQYELIFEYLKKHKIGVDTAVSLDDYLTGEEKDFLAEYLESLSKKCLYTREEKNKMLLKAMEGDSTAVKFLTEAYLTDVVDIAKLYTDQGVLLEDLIGEGNVALAAHVKMLGCEEKVEEAEALLIKKIMEAMEELINETSRDHLADTKVAEQVNNIADDARELAEAFGRKVTVEELSAEGKYSAEEIYAAIKLAGSDGLDVH